jgi:hypothetical protein
MNSDSDGGKLYMKTVAFDEIYNFVVQFFFHLKSSSLTNNRYTIQIRRMQTEIWRVVYRLFNYEDFKRKNFERKVVDLVESYNFHIKFASIRIQTKKYKFLKTD